MSKPTPPMNNLRAFEAAARHLSFQRAAIELHVTPSAISQRIRALEAHLGVQLFKRLTRAVVLTNSGEMLAGDLVNAFGIINTSLARIERAARSNTLTISTTITFAEKWLLPRLPVFSDQFPEIDVRVFSADKLVDFSSDSTDIAIRFGRGQYPDLVSEQFTAESYVPVCSPRLLLDAPPLNDLSDLRYYTLIHTHWQQEMAAAPTWEQCLQAAGIDKFSPKKELGFSVETLSIRAAIDGLGVALANQMLIANDLASGALVQPFPNHISVKSVFNYFLVFPLESRDDTRIQHFRDWLFDEVKK